ncbi:hypothetical protein BDF20DRAFT_860229 [Mycotypha africana]|uniref:uncharacterized protein n=1 Tax=Mycotypha africana TaxID=64632 RepID=UPI0022FFED5C|nr:uncharacterized protein BDF20DRAFT_860229 [Mycotypha africana]KAI8984481.1 hypothetical protein BDF20DRAFT_860229 [Mycotypha africana]
MTKQVVLITGCTQGGIGYSFAKKFAEEGCQVVATARRIEALSGLEEFGCEKEALDITDRQAVNAVVEKVIERFGHIDVLVNNAGVPAVGALMDVDLDWAEQCINTNVFGTLVLSRVVAKHMANRGKGKIVNVGSVVGYASTPWAGIYAMSKAAVHSMSDTLRMELKPFGIQVVVVVPGSIKSNIGTAGVKTVQVPEDSLYTTVSNYIVARANLSQGLKATPTDAFASHVAKRVLKPVSPRYITYGYLCSIFYAFYYLPFFIKDFFFSRRFGLHLLYKNEKKD